MTVETATNISQLNATYPAASDPKSEGDDHIRLIKSTLQATFPNITGVETSSATSNEATKVATTSQVQAAILAATGITAVLPGQGGNGGKFLQTDGTSASWNVVHDVQSFAASGTWTKPANAKFVFIELLGAGGGGGSSAGGSNAAGAGGGGGAYVARMVDAASLPATLTVEVGAGGSGGFGTGGMTRVYNGARDYVRAYGGTFGTSSAAGAGGNGGGTFSDGLNGGLGNGTITGNVALGEKGATGIVNTDGDASLFGGAAGGASRSGGAQKGGSSFMGGPGGGAGGWSSGTGAAGGTSGQLITSTNAGGGIAGGGGAGGASGVAGTAGTAQVFGLAGAGGGGGGGGVTGGAGGAGGYGAGGGGAGACSGGTPTNGGAGGGGYARITTFI